jgi:hypothetical protein
MTGSKLFFLAFAVLLALIGLFAAAASQDIGLSIFGYGLLLFGVLFAYGTIKRIFDEAEKTAH